MSAVDLPIALDGVFLNAAGAYLPGEPIGNDAIDRFIAPLNHKSARIKSRVLRDNGIDTRHYAIDENGNSLFSCAELAARAIRDCLKGAQITLEDVGLLCTGTSGGDLVMPGFASMVHGAWRTGGATHGDFFSRGRLRSGRASFQTCRAGARPW